MGLHFHNKERRNPSKTFPVPDTEMTDMADMIDLTDMTDICDVRFDTFIVTTKLQNYINTMLM